MPARLRPLILPASIMLLAAIVRLAWIASVHPQVGLLDDAGFYHLFATAIADGRGYVREDGVVTAFWPVGYPALLGSLYAIVGESHTAAKLLNVVLGAATTALLYAFARIWLSRAQAAVGATLYALWPGAIAYTSVTMSETLFTFVFLASLYVLAKAPVWRSKAGWAAVGLGVAVALANYVRGQAMLLPLLALPWLTSRHWPRKQATVFVALSLAVVALVSLPWLVRNTMRFDTLTFLSTNTGINFWLGHRDGANGGPDYQAQLTFAQQFDHLPRIEQEPAWSREGLREGLDFMLSHPEQEPRLSVLKVYQLYRSDHDALLWNEQNGATPIFGNSTRDRLTFAMDAYYYAALLLAIVALAYGLRHRQGWAVFVLLVVVYWTAVHVVFYGEPRLRVPLHPLFAMSAGIALVKVWQRIRGVQRTVPGNRIRSWASLDAMRR